MKELLFNRMPLLMGLFLLIVAKITSGQETILSDEEQALMSLEELMNMTVVSASREKEDAFTAPLTSFVISKQEILLSGATSIPEALRLCPAIIVREISNGTFDVSIRGGNDGLPAYSYSYINSSILVMIDNRPVFSTLQGGTYWQNLPIGISDVERIEIVEGASSSLYGPNAVSGVINIITNDKTRFDSKDFYTDVNYMGSLESNIASMKAGRKVSSDLSVISSFNFENRKRFNPEYYDPSRQAYVDVDSIGSLGASDDGTNVFFPYPDQSIRKYGGNIGLLYKPSDDVYLDLTGSANQNMALYPLAGNIAISNFSNASRNVNISGKIKNLSLNTSYLSGTQGLLGNYRPYLHDYRNLDIYFDYMISFFTGGLKILPALSYQYAYANDKPYTVDKERNGTFNGLGEIGNIAGSIKFDANLITNLRVIAAARYDKFNYPKKGYVSFQGILNYSISNRHALRGSVSRSSNGSFLLPTLINVKAPVASGAMLALHGNNELDLPTNTVLELGYRYNFNDMLKFDIVGFSQNFTNFFTSILYIPTFDFAANSIVFNYYNENIPLEVKQKGVTLTLQSSGLDSRIQFRPHVTVQKTELLNYSPYYNQKGAYDMYDVNTQQYMYTFQGHRDSTWNETSKFTPKIVGGFNLIVRPLEKVFIDLSGYYYSNYEMHITKEINSFNGQITNQDNAMIQEKFILNANISYSIKPKFIIFINVRNILNETSHEGFGADKLGSQVLFGLRLNN